MLTSRSINVSEIKIGSAKMIRIAYRLKAGARI